MAKNRGKEKQKGKDSGPQRVRRSSRLKRKLRKTQTKGPHFIDLGEETPEKTPAGHRSSHSQSYIEHSPLHSQSNVDMSPFQPDFEVNSPPRHFGTAQ